MRAQTSFAASGFLRPNACADNGACAPEPRGWRGDPPARGQGVGSTGALAPSDRNFHADAGPGRQWTPVLIAALGDRGGRRRDSSGGETAFVSAGGCGMVACWLRVSCRDTVASFVKSAGRTALTRATLRWRPSPRCEPPHRSCGLSRRVAVWSGPCKHRRKPYERNSWRRRR
jgi:hypothetical protein